MDVEAKAGLGTMVQFTAFYEEFPLDTMHRAICESTGKLEAEALAVVK